MNSPDYTFNGLGGFDYWSNVMNNPYFINAWNSRNVNFKGYAESKDTSSTAYDTSATGSSPSGAIPVTQPAQTNSDNSSGLGTATGIGLTLIAGGGALYLLKQGKFTQAKKAITSALGISENKILTKLRAIKCPEGIRFNIPGKKITRSGNKIQALVDEYGIQASVNAERKAFNSAHSVVDSFRVTVGKDKYVIHMKDGEITKVVDEIGENILPRLSSAETASADGTMLEKFKNILKEFSKKKDIDRTIMRDVGDIRYTNTFGDDVLKLTSETYGADPRLREFSTLQRFKFSDTEMQAYKLSSAEEAFADSKFYKDGKLIDGITVESFTKEIGSTGVRGNFEGETLISIVKPDGSICEEGTAGYQAFVKENQKEIDKLINRVFVKREEIPDGAILSAAA